MWEVRSRGEGTAVVKHLKGDLNCLVISCWTNMGLVNKKPRICVDTRWTRLVHYAAAVLISRPSEKFQLHNAFFHWDEQTSFIVRLSVLSVCSSHHLKPWSRFKFTTECRSNSQCLTMFYFTKKCAIHQWWPLMCIEKIELPLVMSWLDVIER